MPVKKCSKDYRCKFCHKLLFKETGHLTTLNILSSLEGMKNKFVKANIRESTYSLDDKQIDDKQIKVPDVISIQVKCPKCNRLNTFVWTVDETEIYRFLKK